MKLITATTTLMDAKKIYVVFNMDRASHFGVVTSTDKNKYVIKVPEYSGVLMAVRNKVEFNSLLELRDSVMPTRQLIYECDADELEKLIDNAEKSITPVHTGLTLENMV